MPWLGALLANLLGSAVARVLTGAGLALVTTAALMPLVLSLLNTAAQKFNGIAQPILQVMLLCGVGEAVSILGAAMLTRVAINAASIAIKKA